MPIDCQRYLKIPQIRRLKIPQLRPNPIILTIGGRDGAPGGITKIQKLITMTVSVSEIVRQLEVDRKTVRKYLRQAPRAYERNVKS